MLRNLEQPTKKWAFAHCQGSPLNLHCSVFAEAGEGGLVVGEICVERELTGVACLSGRGGGGGRACLAVDGGKFYEFLCRESRFSGLRTLRNRESAGTLGGMGVEPAIKVSGSGTSGGSGFSASGGDGDLCCGNLCGSGS